MKVKKKKKRIQVFLGLQRRLIAYPKMKMFGHAR